MEVSIRPLAFADVGAASLVVQGGSLTPEVEDEANVDAYWSAVEETRRRRGEVLVAEVNGEVVGVCQVLIFQHFQHTGGWCCELESMHVRSDQRGHGIGSKLTRIVSTRTTVSNRPVRASRSGFSQAPMNHNRVFVSVRTFAFAPARRTIASP